MEFVNLLDSNHSVSGYFCFPGFIGFVFATVTLTLSRLASVVVVCAPLSSDVGFLTSRAGCSWEIYSSSTSSSLLFLLLTVMSGTTH